jgi:PAS domain S-box-containing protein
MSLGRHKSALSGLALIAVLLVANSGVSYWNTLRVARNQEWVSHTRWVHAVVEEVRATITEAEAGQRGFLLTGDSSYLETFAAGTRRIDDRLRLLKELTADNPEQQSRVDHLHRLIHARLDRLQHNVSVRQQQGLEAARAIVNTDDGQLLMDRIRRQVAAMEKEESALLGTRLAESRRSLRTTQATTIVGSLLGLLAVGLAFLLFRRTLEERRRSERRQAALAEMRHQALWTASLDDLMQRAVELIAEVLAVPLVKVLELQPDGHGFLLKAGVGWREGAVGTATVGAGLDSQAGYTLHASRPLVVGDLTTHEPIVVEDLRSERRFSGPALLTEHGVVSGMSVIIYDRPDRSFGVLGAHTTARRRFSRDDTRFLQATANMLAAVVRQRRSVEALRESERRFRALADSVPEVVWTSGPGGRCDYLNRRWTELSSMTPEEAGSDGWLAAVHEGDRGAARQRWARSLETGEPFEHECRFRDRDGSPRWHLGRAAPLRDSEGRIVKWFGNWTDIDERKRMEERLKDADRQKNVFLATLGHELRNPLASIVAVAELLKPLDGAEDELARSVAVILDQARQLRRLVDDLLDTARISEGKIRIVRESVDLAGTVSQALEEVRAQVDGRRHELTVELPREPVLLFADGARLVQVLANLVSNAARYTPPGGRIAIRVTPEDGAVVIQVRDTGKGIPPDLLPRVFEMFSQGKSTGDLPPEGLGIGLALVKKLVELHGGSVEARSDGPGRGSEFRVRLPLPTGAPAAAVSSEEAAVAGTAIAPVRVLVVEDHPVLADSFARVLRREGCQVHTAGDGREALSRARQLRPEIAFVDVGLPDMSGYDLVQRLRSEESCAATVFVAVTGYGDAESERRMRQAGFHRRLGKPVELTIVRRLLSGLERPAPPGPATHTDPGPTTTSG